MITFSSYVHRTMTATDTPIVRPSSLCFNPFFKINQIIRSTEWNVPLFVSPSVYGPKDIL